MVQFAKLQLSRVLNFILWFLRFHFQLLVTTSPFSHLSLLSKCVASGNFLRRWRNLESFAAQVRVYYLRWQAPFNLLGPSKSIDLFPFRYNSLLTLLDFFIGNCPILFLRTKYEALATFNIYWCCTERDDTENELNGSLKILVLYMIEKLHFYS